MYSFERYIRAVETWQNAWIVGANMMLSAADMMRQQAADIGLAQPDPKEALRLTLDKPATFIKSYEKASRAAATRRALLSRD